MAADMAWNCAVRSSGVTTVVLTELVSLVGAADVMTAGGGADLVGSAPIVIEPAG